MKHITLTQGQFTLVDDKDFEVIKNHKFRYHNAGYAYIIIDNKPFLLHRFLLQPLPKQEVDHKNGDRLDNTRGNLRACSTTENRRNASVHSNSKTGIKGVWLDKTRNKFTSQILFKGKKIYLGRFDTLQEATKAYNNAASIYYKEFAKLNVI